MELELIVFDWDGTLVDSSAPIARAVRQAAAEAELPVPSEAAARSIIGLGLTEVGYRLFPEADGAGVQRFADAYRELYWAAPEEFTRPFPGVPELLAELAAERPLAIATGKGRKGLDLALERTALGAHITASRCADETCSKPHPQMLEEILAELAIAPGAALMVGDTSFDMAMAQAAGVRGVGVLGGSHPDAEMREAGAEVVLGGVTDLRGWLAD